MVTNQLYVILHGHFYQPPREEPWTNEIDRQPSAHPFHDWNERINKECYAANSSSRILDSSGRIEEILNNYEYLSFNFGPTLMSWIKKKDYPTYLKIIEGDRFSMEKNNGHGNAIAQVYNHMILPLASEQDIITQIKWGLMSFEQDFGRKAEGIWLAETAINHDVVRKLIDEGIKFIILAPTQAKAVKHLQDHHSDWTDVSNNSIDPSKAYLLKESNGEIAVFFYYGHIASKLSFEHLLRNVDFIRGELLANNNPEKASHLVHVATDGETYGHHEPFGDMCLSRLIYENRELKDFQFTNYGRFLEQYLPEFQVILKEGNDGLGTAWSCAHGVDRWRKDCGCSTGGQSGWNQKWREDFRNALDFLRDALFASAEENLKSFYSDIWKARNDYGQVILAVDDHEREKALERFFLTCEKKNLDQIEKTFIIRFMEALHHAMLMYTSCGWFFSEISGIETVQDLKYAGRIFDLVGDYLPKNARDEFLEILMKAKSNIADFHNGKWIYENFVEKFCYSANHLINEFILEQAIFQKQTLENDDRYFYNIKIIKKTAFPRTDLYASEFCIELHNKLLSEVSHYIGILIRKDFQFRVYIKKAADPSLSNYLSKIVSEDHEKNLFQNLSEWFPRYYNLQDVSFDYKVKFLDKLFEKQLYELHKRNEKSSLPMDDLLLILNYHKELNVPLKEKDQIALREYLNQYILDALDELKKSGNQVFDFSELIKVIQTVKKTNLFLDYMEILPLMENYVLERTEKAILNYNPDELNNLEKFIDFTNNSGIDFEKYEIQNTLYEKLNDLLSGKSKAEAKLIQALLRLASKFNISIKRYEVLLHRS